MYIMNFNQATTKIQTLVVRSDSNPVDWTSQIQINEREYDKAYIQLIDVGMNLANTGAFPANETDARVIVNLESNLGQRIYDTNGNFFLTVTIVTLPEKPTILGQGDPMVCITEQVTPTAGNNPISTTGSINIDNGALTYIPFAGGFTNNGITHLNNSPLFNINVAAEYTINVQLRVTAGGVNERGMYWVICRRYKNRPANNNTRGNQFRDYYLGSSYYRDDTDAFDEIVLGGNVRIHFEGNDENFEIVVQRAYQQNVNSGNNPLNNSESFITIERHAYQVA